MDEVRNFISKLEFFFHLVTMQFSVLISLYGLLPYWRMRLVSLLERYLRLDSFWVYVKASTSKFSYTSNQLQREYYYRSHHPRLHDRNLHVLYSC
jgi:hypothetical protein